MQLIRRFILVIYGSYRAGDIPHSHASIDKAKENLKYDPKFNLQQGLREAAMELACFLAMVHRFQHI